METLQRVESLSLKKLNNAEYAYFMDRVAQLIAVAGNQNIGLSDEDSTAFSALITEITATMNTSKASDQTAILHELDTQRDNTLSSLIGTIRSACKSPIESKSAAATALYAIIKPFLGIQGLPLSQQSVQIKSMTEHLSSDTATMHMQTLSLTEELDLLVQLNNDYITHSDTRTESKTTASCAPLREKCDSYYGVLTVKAVSVAIALATAEAISFIESLNKHIEDTKTAYNKRLAQLNSSETLDEE